uniref:Uncharacterized protein n=1 Tax=Arundo donax TaxID=35708 RepID=A0A0A8YYZ0_ARUDO
MYVLYIKLSKPTKLQCEIHPRCQERKEISNQFALFIMCSCAIFLVIHCGN